jgi:hypothetical protein
MKFLRIVGKLIAAALLSLAIFLATSTEGVRFYWYGQ